MTAICAHHWILGQPNEGRIEAVCRKCDSLRDYPAVLEDLDPSPEPDWSHLLGVVTAVGGARPSPVATLWSLLERDN